jgi:hypothetical protein
MATRPPRDLRAEAKSAFSRRLAREGCRVPDLLATELLAILDGHHISLTDTTQPADPNADWHPPAHPTPAPPDDYRAARAALKGQTQ